MSKLRQSIELIIQQNLITVYSKSYCPYCTRAKSFLKTKLDPLKISFHTIELDLLPGSQASDLQSALAEKLGKSRVTVPQIFINQQPIGGCDDLLSLEKRGELDQILSKLQSQS